MLILASGSPTRKALLANAGIAFEAVPARVNEREIDARSLVEHRSGEEIAVRLAEAKALAVPGEIVVGADQILELEGTVLHKPTNFHEAQKRLDQLAGRTHQLHTAVAIAREGRIIWASLETASLTMRAFSEEERDAVLAAEGEGALSSAGAYRLEGPSVRLFEKIDGDYFSILGLPLLPLIAALRHHAPETLERFT